jgi:hypothetical protein
MSILVRWAPENGTLDQYDEILRRLDAADQLSPDGQELHVAFEIDGKVRVSEIWDSQEQFEAHGADLMPVLQDVGLDPGEPQIVEVHNLIKR